MPAEVFYVPGALVRVALASIPATTLRTCRRVSFVRFGCSNSSPCVLVVQRFSFFSGTTKGAMAVMPCRSASFDIQDTAKRELVWD